MTACEVFWTGSVIINLDQPKGAEQNKTSLTQNKTKSIQKQNEKKKKKDNNSQHLSWKLQECNNNNN